MDIGISGLSMEHGDIGLLAKRIEELGFDSIWFPEHPVIPVRYKSKWGGSPDGSVPDFMAHLINPFIALAYASATTKTLKLGTGVCLVTEHNPLDLAKQISTLDSISGGRFLFGIGTGWFREESEIMGADFDHRWTQAKEYVLAMKELWTMDQAEFHGHYVDFPAVRCNPKPVQKPHPPVLLGGTSENVFKRVARWGDGWLPIAVTPDDVRHARSTLTKLAKAEHRDPESITINIYGQNPDPELIKGFQEAGANSVSVRVSTPGQAGVLSELDGIAKKLLS